MTALSAAVRTRPPESGTNPFVGPRALLYGEPLFGRDREVIELTDILIRQPLAFNVSTDTAAA